MKIGAGGLQSLAVQEVLPVKKIEPVQTQKQQENVRSEMVSHHSRVDPEALNKVVEKLNKTSELFNQRLTFKVHEETKRLIVKVIDDRTGEVVKEIPPKEMLELEESISEMIGMILDKHV